MYLLQESRFFVQGNVAFIHVSFLSHAINPYKQWTHDISLEQSLYKPCVSYQQKNQRNVWKIDWNTVLIQKSITWTSGCYEKTSCNNFNLLDFLIYFLVITLLELICYFFGGTEIILLVHNFVDPYLILQFWRDGISRVLFSRFQLWKRALNFTIQAFSMSFFF